MTALVRIRGLRRSYGGRTVLRVEELDVRQGEILAVVGPNGSGKSTLLRIINLLERPSEGEIIYWDGSTLTGMGRGGRKELSRQMAMIFQEPLLFKRSVAANVAYGLKARRVKRGEREKRVRDILARLGMEEFFHRHVRTLSGGEAQKVNLARAMVLQPRLLLLDEPLASLDFPTRRDLRREIVGLTREMGVTAVYVTHDYHEVLEVADRLAVLLGGVLRQVGTPGEVFARPADEEVAAFLGAENLWEGEILQSEGGMARIAVGTGVVEALTGLPPGSRVKVMVHPEEVVLFSGVKDAGSARNRLPARVLSVRETGALVRVDLDCGFPLVAYITRASRREMGIEPGQDLTAAFKATSLHVMG